MITDLYIDIQDDQYPIIYRKEYNVNFCLMEKLHPFDAAKWGHIFKILKRKGLVDQNTVVVPNEASETDLLLVHSKKYLRSLKNSFVVARIAEVVPLMLLPNLLIQRAFLRPMRYQTGGSILAAKLAIERGWAINVGGGFHHCSANKGGGFCVYADITLMIRFLFANFRSQVSRVMIVDLDAHQGNGYANDFKNNSKIYIVDFFNKWAYPNDETAKQYITRMVHLDYLVEDGEYLSLVRKHVNEALEEFDAALLVYNAGTDILKGDSLGGLCISETGVIKRDEIVFRAAKVHSVPIVMLTSGGYLRKSASIIAKSIINLHESGLINSLRESYEKTA